MHFISELLAYQDNTLDNMVLYHFLLRSGSWDNQMQEVRLHEFEFSLGPLTMGLYYTAYKQLWYIDSWDSLNLNVIPCCLYFSLPVNYVNPSL